MTDWLSRSAEQAGAVHSEAFNAPLFRSLLEKLKNRERRVVLDLGAARAQTVALFSQFRCRLEIADVAGGLEALNVVTEPKRLHHAAEALLPRRRAEPADIVFCWDILNYLERPAMQAIMSSVAARAKRGTLIHALIVYSETHMTAQPGCYVPQDDYSLLNVAAGPENRPAPRYSPEDLSLCLPDYAIDRVMLLGNGMQEFLFRL